MISLWAAATRSCHRRLGWSIEEGQERQIFQSQGSPATEEAAKNEGNGPHKGHPSLPLELSGLVEIESREYAGQVPETQAWHGG